MIQTLFNDALEKAERLSLEEQESLIQLMRKRIIEKRREQIASNIQEVHQAYASGQYQAATPEVIMRETMP